LEPMSAISARVQCACLVFAIDSLSELDSAFREGVANTLY
jgi:hypothetical protein